MATLCLKNIEQTQKIQEGNKEKTKKKTNPQINYKDRLWSFVFITFGLSWVVPRSIPNLLFGLWN